MQSIFIFLRSRWERYILRQREQRLFGLWANLHRNSVDGQLMYYVFHYKISLNRYNLFCSDKADIRTTMSSIRSLLWLPRYMHYTFLKPLPMSIILTHI